MQHYNHLRIHNNNNINKKTPIKFKKEVSLIGIHQRKKIAIFDNESIT